MAETTKCKRCGQEQSWRHDDDDGMHGATQKAFVPDKHSKTPDIEPTAWVYFCNNCGLAVCVLFDSDLAKDAGPVQLGGPEFVDGMEGLTVLLQGAIDAANKGMPSTATRLVAEANDLAQAWDRITGEDS
jgi:hypothetical protein